MTYVSRAREGLALNAETIMDMVLDFAAICVA